jgi:hypothetical protein
MLTQTVQSDENVLLKELVMSLVHGLQDCMRVVLHMISEEVGSSDLGSFASTLVKLC